MKQWIGCAMLALASVAAGCGDDDGNHHAGTGGTGGAGTGGAGTGGGGTGGDLDAGNMDASGPDGGPGVYTINFRAVVGDEAFACGTHYNDLGTPGRTATPVDFRFYVQDVRLVRSDATEVPLALAQNEWQHQNVALIDFEDGAGACEDGDALTNMVITGTAPAGDYVGLKLSVGVPTELNHADLSTAPAPLNKSGLFWGWNMGHIFFAAVSRSMQPHAADGGDDADAGSPHGGDHVTHIGATGCNGDPAGGGDPVTSCAKPNRAQISFAEFDNSADAVVVDFAAVKRGSDVMMGGPCHSFTADTCNTPFANLGIDFATGGPTTTMQTVFRKE